MSALGTLRRDIRSHANPVRAKALAGYFKTGKGEYGHGDVFLGLTVPSCRTIARRFMDLPLADIARALESKFHEERLIALLILVERDARGNAASKRKTYDFYLTHAERVNNWDLVDLSAHKIVGEHLVGRAKTPLTSLARSRNLWKRRIAIVATAAFIRRRQFAETFRLCDLLLHDSHDLLHKACGWMLREVGKRDKAALTRWLKPRVSRMPRTMLRYAIEKFPERERQRYLRGTVR